jgi:hypothetical protein
MAFFQENHKIGASGTSTTFSVDITGAGSNVTLVLDLDSGDDTHDVHATAATWNGVSFTQVGTTATGGINGTLNMWVLANVADIGAFDLVVTWSDDIAAYGGAISMLTYNDTSAIQPDAYVSPASQTGNFSINITTVADNATIVLLSNYGGSAGADTTQRGATIGWEGERAVTIAGAYTVAENTGDTLGQIRAGALSLAPPPTSGWVHKPTYFWDGTVWQPIDVTGV